VIFVTIGSVFPFDRLVAAADAWARGRGAPPAPLNGAPGPGGGPDPAPDPALDPALDPGPGGVLAQIGDGRYRPAHMRWVRRLDQDAYLAVARRARLIVAHAGMGSVITAGQLGKPIVILPRRQGLGEHNTDHQLATANWLRGKPGVYVAGTEGELAACIDAALALAPEAVETLPPHAPDAFIARIRALLQP
jgi:UDP-N-acetylglucosamine transferase subunit ALG13